MVELRIDSSITPSHIVATQPQGNNGYDHLSRDDPPQPATTLLGHPNVDAPMGEYNTLDFVTPSSSNAGSAGTQQHKPPQVYNLIYVYYAFLSSMKAGWLASKCAKWAQMYA